MEAMQAELLKLRNDHDQLRNLCAQQKVELDQTIQTRPAATAQCPGGPASAPASASTAPDIELRTAARMGNLGWDLPPEESQQRCKDVLAEAKVDDKTILAIGSRGTKTSGCNVEFATPYLETVVEIARAGVDRISVGGLTHSARCLDVGLDWLPGDVVKS